MYTANSNPISFQPLVDILTNQRPKDICQELHCPPPPILLESLPQTSKSRPVSLLSAEVFQCVIPEVGRKQLLICNQHEFTSNL